MLTTFLWPAAKVTLYATFLLISVALLLVGLEKMSELILKQSYLGQVYPGREDMMRRDFTRPVSHYDYDFVPGVCLQYNTVKGNRYEYANNAGFREPRPISKDKPADEFRIFLTGGSTAYGLGSIGEAAHLTDDYSLEYRETISHQLEKILNARMPLPGKTIRVYNTAVWGYSYQHSLMRYMVKLREYKPDMVIALDGANELPMISKLNDDWNYFQEGQFHGIFKDIHAYSKPGLMSYLSLWLKNNTFLMAWLWQGRDPFQEFGGERQTHTGAVDAHTQRGAGHLTGEDRRRMAENHMDPVLKTIENYHSALENDGTDHIFALQPWFYSSKKPKHEKEKVVDSVEGHKNYYGLPSAATYAVLLERIRESAQKKGYFLADMSDYFDDVNERVFTDWCHLTAGANYLIAKELANLVKEHFFKMGLDPADVVSAKDSYFWDMAASSTVTYAPPAASDEEGPRAMLQGYPSERTFMSKEMPEGEPLEIVLDLKADYEISRLRLVWAGKAAVPQKWLIEHSQNGVDWELFKQGDDKDLDDFSWWPGHEYYAPEPVTARFFRYKPVDGPRRIQLKLWSLYR